MAQAATRLLTVALLISYCHAAGADDRPNVVLIMADDMGYSDLGCYGSEIETPTLDGLAGNGVRFTQFYNTGRCCPTRASLLTGLYPHQAGIGWMMTDRGHDGYRGDLNRRSMTIAEVLKSAGYATYMTGKWHVTKHVQPDGPKDNWPLQRGFDRFYGTITGAGSFYDPGTLTRDNTMVSPFADSEYQPKQYYYTDAISDHAVRFVDEHYNHPRAEAVKPFFMYVAYTCAHWPMHALEEDIEKYRGKYDQGYAPIRAARHDRVKELGLVDPQWQLTPQVGKWDQVEHQAWEARNMEVYAAMIDNMDRGIGRIVESLKKNNQLDNTLILYLQDNGGCQEGIGRTGDLRRPVKPSLPKIARDAIRLDVIPKQDRDGVPTLQGPHIMPGPADTYIAYGINWANVSNTPFREYKHFVHEGGIATPLIAHWPTGIAKRGRLQHQPGHLIDLMATCVDLAEADYPKSRGGKAIKPMEGVSLVPAFKGESLNRRQPIFWEHEGNRAVRDGQWKLVVKENQPWELYDMRQDRTETKDLAREKPDIAKRLATAWDAYAARADVLPLGAWRGQRGTFNKKQKRFELKQGDSLAQGKAPFIKGRAISITAKVEGISAADGVIVAQGGTADGFALYVKDGKLVFATRRAGKLAVVTSRQALPASVKEISARLAKQGAITLWAAGQQIGQGESTGALPRMPIDGLQVGRDDGGAVGDYRSPSATKGKIISLALELGD